MNPIGNTGSTDFRDPTVSPRYPKHRERRMPKSPGKVSGDFKNGNPEPRPWI